MAKLLNILEDIYIGKYKKFCGVFSKKDGDTVQLVDEEVLSTGLLPIPSELTKEVPSIVLGALPRAIQYVVVSYEALLSLIGVEVDLHQILMDKRLDGYQWMKENFFKGVRSFTEDVFNDALFNMDDIVYDTQMEQTYTRNNDLLVIKTDSCQIIKESLILGATGVLLSLYTQTCIAKSIRRELTLTSYALLQNETSMLEDFIKEQNTIYLMENFATEYELTTMNEIAEDISKAPNVSIDVLIEALHNAEIVDTYQNEEGKYVIEMNPFTFKFMLSPNGLSNILGGFDMIKVRVGQDYLVVTKTNKEVTTRVKWDDVLSIFLLVTKPEYGVAVVEDSKKFKIKVQRVACSQ